MSKKITKLQISFHENQFSSNLAVLIKYYLKSHYNLYFDQLGKYSWHRDLLVTAGLRRTSV